jgi:hypothetical protein
MRLKLTILLLVFTSILFSQLEISWIKEFNTGRYYETGTSLTETNNHDGYLLCGYKDSSLFIYKLNTSGDTLWTKQYSTSVYWYNWFNIQKTGTAYFITGVISNTEGFDDEFLMKIDENGDSLWTRRFSTVPNISICLTPDTGIAVMGSAHLGNEWKTSVCKFDYQGNILWQYYYGNAEISSGQDFICSKDSGFAIVGE